MTATDTKGCVHGLIKYIKVVMDEASVKAADRLDRNRLYFVKRIAVSGLLISRPGIRARAW